MTTSLWIYGAAAALAGWAAWRFATQYYKFLEDGWNRGKATRSQIEGYLRKGMTGQEPVDNKDPTPPQAAA